MGHKVGDAVRLRPGSDWAELVEPWDEAAGKVTHVYGEPERVIVLYAEEGPVAFGIPAAEFEPDRTPADAPF